MSLKKLNVFSLLLLFVKHSFAQYDYGESTISPDYQSYPDVSLTTDPNPTDFETQPTETPPEETTNGGVDDGLVPTTFVDYSNYDVITEPPIVVNPASTGRPNNRVPKTIINWYLLGPRLTSSVRRKVQPMRRPLAGFGYGMPWNQFYGYNRSRYVAQNRPAARHIPSGVSSSGTVIRYFWRV